MNSIDLSYLSDGIANQVRVENALTGIRTTATNATSVTAYGRQLADFIVEFDPSSGTTFANWASAVANAADPKNIRSVSVPAIRRDGLASVVLLADVGEPLQVEFASTGLPTLQELYMITKMNHVITAEHWELNIGLWRGI
jgi:hypothetical protein